MRRVLLAWALVLALPSVAAAQAAALAHEDETTASAAEPESSVGGAPRRPDQLDPAQPITLRPERRLRSMAIRVARTLALRSQVEVHVGDAPPPIVEAVVSGHVGMVRDGAELLVALGAPQGLVYTSRVDMPSGRDAAVRAVALAVEALRDAAIEGPPQPAPGEEGDAASGGRSSERVSYVYIEQEGGIFGVRRRTEATARPVIFARMLVGFSTARDTALIGPGVGIGLCIDISCLVIEGDLPIIPESRLAEESREIILYRPISFAMRVGFRPWRWGDFVPAIVAGILTRFGNAWVDNALIPAEQTVTDFGLRGSVELAWIFWAPFELVAELGVDIVFNPAEFHRGREVVILEDVVTMWGVLTLRLRP